MLAVMWKVGLVLLALAAILAALLFRTRFESSFKELERSQQVMSRATSWTVEIDSKQPNEESASHTTTIKRSCPADSDWRMTFIGHDGIIRERGLVVSRGFSYEETPLREWRKSKTSPDYQPSAECGRGPNLVNGILSNDLNELKLRKREPIKGQLRTIDETQCQEFSLDFGYTWPPMSAYAVCIDPATHLPMQVTVRDTHVVSTFSNWNQTTITPPVP
jgi:hypothetical protein